MAFRYFDYGGRPARLMLDDRDVPEFCEVWDPERKRLVRDDGIELDLFFNTNVARAISQEEFETLLARSDD